MAEIRIEKEKNNNWLPWLLGVVGLLLLGWLAVDFFDKDGEPELLTQDEVNFPDAHIHDEDKVPLDVVNAQRNEDVTTATVVADEHGHHYDDKFAHDLADDFDEDWDGTNADYKSNVTYYLSSIDRISEDMNVHHDYSSTALTALANSISAIARDEDIENPDDLVSKCNSIKQKAVAITKDWRSTNHADMIKAAALQACDLVKDVQTSEFPNLANEVAEMEQAANKIKPGTLTLDQKKQVKTFFREAADVLQQMNTSV